MDNNIPPPPKPPECRIQCSCGFTAPESEFKEKHKVCWPERLIWTAYGCFVVSVVVGGAIFVAVKSGWI